MAHSQSRPPPREQMIDGVACVSYDFVGGLVGVSGLVLRQWERESDLHPYTKCLRHRYHQFRHTTMIERKSASDFLRAWRAHRHVKSSRPRKSRA